MFTVDSTEASKQDGYYSFFYQELFHLQILYMY